MHARPSPRFPREIGCALARKSATSTCVRARALSLSLSLALSLGCTVAESIDVSTPVAGSLSSGELTVDERIALSLAQSLESARHRSHLFSMLRRSELAQHKISLRALLQDPAAATLRRDLDLRLATAGVPMMDPAAQEAIHVWFPSIEDRKTWGAADPLAVTAALTASSKQAFAVSGQPVQLDVQRRATSRYATLVLERARFTPRRLRLASAADARTISDGDDGGIALVSVNQSGDTTIVHVRDDSGLPGEALASSSGFFGMYLKGLMLVGARDHGSFTDPLELRFRAKLRRTLDYSEIRSATLHVDGYGNDFVAALNQPIINAVPTSGAFVELYVYEEDGGWANDDLGTYTFTTGNASSMNWHFRSAFFPTFQATQTSWRCNWNSPLYGTFLCPWSLSDGVVTSWREVNFNVAWDPNQTTPPQLGVTGPFIVQAGTTHEYAVDFVPGGSAPYTYRWFRDGVLVGEGPTISLSFPTAATAHQLVVDVTDPNEYWQQRQISISVNNGQCDPADPGCHEYIRVPPPSRPSP